MLADCATTDMLTVRLMVRLGTCLGFTFGCADTKGAFRWSGPIIRSMYVIPLNFYPHERDELCKLLKSSYGMRDAGQKWVLKI